MFRDYYRIIKLKILLYFYIFQQLNYQTKIMIYVFTFVIITLSLLVNYLRTILENNNTYILHRLNSYTEIFDKNNINEIGFWGEDKLSSTLNSVGYYENINFFRNKTFYIENKMFRPDCVLYISDDTSLVIDVKTPWISYSKYLQSSKIDQRQKLIKEHAITIKKHIKDLASKRYYRIKTSLPFIIVFIPIDNMFTDACKQNYDLLKFCKINNIFVATPSTLYTIISIICALTTNRSFSKLAIQNRYDIEFITNNISCIIHDLDLLSQSLSKKSKDILEIKKKLHGDFLSRLKHLKKNNVYTEDNSLVPI
jgi:DNA recombination protein RmuC